jgi:hypothetical protein
MDRKRAGAIGTKLQKSKGMPYGSAPREFGGKSSGVLAIRSSNPYQ